MEDDDADLMWIGIFLQTKEIKDFALITDHKEELLMSTQKYKL